MVDFFKKVRGVTGAPDDCARETMDTVLKAGQLGNPGDGKIFVLRVDDVCRIRTNAERRRFFSLHFTLFG